MRTAALTIALALIAVTAHAQAADRLRPPNDDRAATQHYNSGWGALTAEHWDEAAREFQSAIDLNDRFKLAYYGLGRAGMGQRRFADAIRAYEKCRDLYEMQASQNFANRGEAERMMADDFAQIDTAISRLQAGPQSPSTSLQIRQLEMQKERLKNRTMGANTLSLTSPVPPFVMLALGSAYLRAERFADAEQAYKKAVDGDPKYGEAYSNLAALYLMTSRYDDAAAAVKAAEKAGFHVNPAMKQEIDTKRKGGSSQ